MLKIHVEKGKCGHAFYSKKFSGRLLEQDSGSFIVHPNEETTSEGSGVTPHDALREFIESNIPLVTL